MELLSEDAARGDTRTFRAWYRARIPGWYHGWLHALLTAGTVTTSCSLALVQLDGARPWEWAFLLVMLVAGSLTVWLLHSGPLHRPMSLVPFSYNQHTRMHHFFFTDEMIVIHRACDAHTLLFPIWMALLISAGLGPGLFAALAALGATNLGALAWFGAVAYFGLYELHHTASHLPRGHGLYRVPLLGSWLFHIREAHRMHHKHSLMNRANFNIVLPIFDHLFGTVYRGEPSVERDIDC